jgi:FixJ family two-component response regulator
VVLDVDLAGDDGLSLLPEAAAGASVMVLTSHGDVATRARAARLGAHAFVEKSAPAAELLAALARLGATRAVSDFGWEESPTRPGPSGPLPTV